MVAKSMYRDAKMNLAFSLGRLWRKARLSGRGVIVGMVVVAESVVDVAA